MESYLNAIVSIRKFIPSDEAEVPTFSFEMLPRPPTDKNPLRFTLNKLIGKYASWLAAHPQLLQPNAAYGNGRTCIAIVRTN